ncbi:MAG: 50S ribosomal protein L3 [Methylophilales bacterium BACL14 MAG-120910-bin43]|jgi:large subunit ribosomal protein L3|nr:MAG: 50S ribosomal protein L3 [Methylophilales bacterium BACL14 MAG-120910-bin43]KRP06570.1 MAG: 50S ribosomal protein L3 [Methylophilales bacterium BACL14 MAG-120920-bin58]|tara:strand:+ start:621 stop:1271 length:651 start_codon:yes stop_codon:yes gene_type:complete
MSLGLIGRKVGMTRVFTDEGASIPVTVLEVVPNRVTQIKKLNSDGYSSLQLAYGKSKSTKLNKSLVGHYAKASVEAGLGLHELRLSEEEISKYTTESILSVEIFQVGQKVDVTGTTIGKGFQGPIKRHHFSSNRATHGVSISHNSHGSTGQCQDPGRVFPGKKMAGHLGDKKRTTQNLEVVRIDSPRNLILIKGAIPGSKGSDVLIKPAVKSQGGA